MAGRLGSKAGQHRDTHSFRVDKACSSCKKIKLIDCFYPHTRSDRGGAVYRQGECKTCRALTKRAARYDTSKEFLRGMREAQESLCALCGGALEDDYHVDHDHNTQEIRALLCPGCNTGLGLFKESPSALRAAADYLEGRAV